MRGSIKLITAIILTCCIIGACKSSISLFDQYAYTQTTSIKVDALNVMDLAVEDISSHKKEVDAIKTQMQKVYEYEKNRPKNTITLTMWEEMIKPKGKLFGGFISFWESKSSEGEKLNSKFIDDEKALIGTAFDQIAQLESKKIKK